MTEPAPAIIITSLGESSVKLAVRMWVKNSNYWDVIGDMNESIYKTLPAKGINFPFPQLDVHVHNN